MFLVQELVPKLLCVMTFYNFYQLISLLPQGQLTSNGCLFHSREIACFPTTLPLLRNCSMLGATIVYNDIFTHADISSKLYDC